VPTDLLASAAGLILKDFTAASERAVASVLGSDRLARLRGVWREAHAPAQGSGTGQSHASAGPRPGTREHSSDTS
jgi:hypothetical protein